MDKRKILINIFAGLTIVAAFFAWLSVQRAIVVSDSSTWTVPMVLFSAYLFLICLDILLSRSMFWLMTILIASLLVSLTIVFSPLQFFAIIVSSLFIFLAARKIKNDMDFNLKISPWKSLQAGRTYLLIALSLLITVQYFSILSNFEGEKKVPYLDTSFITKKVAIPIFSSISPQFKALEDETLTVDQVRTPPPKAVA